MNQQQRLFDFVSLQVWAHVDVGICGLPQGPLFSLKPKRRQRSAYQQQDAVVPLHVLTC